MASERIVITTIVTALQNLANGDGVQAEVKTLSDHLDTLQTEADADKSAEATDATSITGLTTRVTALEGEVADIQAGLSAGQAQVAPIVLSPTAAPDATTGTAYDAVFAASGGAGGPFTSALATADVLPDGLAFTSSDTGFSITGTVAADAAAASVTATVTDSGGTSAEFPLSIAVAQPAA